MIVWTDVSQFFKWHVSIQTVFTAALPINGDLGHEEGPQLPVILKHNGVVLQLNGNTYPAVVSPGTGAATTFTATVPAPAIPSSVVGPYPVVVNYTPDSTAFAAPVPPFSFNLPVGPATTTITQTVTPTTAAVGSNLTVSGTIASSNGAAPQGILTITVSSWQTPS